MKLIAIDPGKSGGIAWHVHGRTWCQAMPETDGETLALLRLLQAAGHDLIVMEKINGFISAAGAGQMFHFGEGYGKLQMIALCLGFRLELVTPQAWQKSLSCGKKKDHGKDWKTHLLKMAQRLYPHLKITKKTADALLILDYARKNQLAQ
ncbi:MAG: hypothetical protein KGL39_22805 [Patescibacteria group bacterium]|nr:hypothetical protein [Patescibacteria group bacterium]